MMSEQQRRALRRYRRRAHHMLLGPRKVHYDMHVETPMAVSATEHMRRAMEDRAAGYGRALTVREVLRDRL
jgi:hypothetical protein